VLGVLAMLKDHMALTASSPTRPSKVCLATCPPSLRALTALLTTRPILRAEVRPCPRSARGSQEHRPGVPEPPGPLLRREPVAL